MKRLNLIFLAWVFISFACTNLESKNQGPFVATAFGKQLHVKELQNALPPNISRADSATMANAYIRNWIEQESLLNIASTNLTENEKNVEDLVNKYRNSLLIFRYESKYLKQRLDTMVLEEEMVAYHKENPDNFVLNEPVYRIRFLEADSTDRLNYKYWQWIKSDLKDDLNDLDIQVEENQYQYLQSSSTWYAKSDIAEYFPDVNGSLTNILAKASVGVYTKYSNGRKLYLYLEEVLNVGDRMPLQFARDEIRLQIVNKRRLELLKALRSESVNKALNSKNAEINLPTNPS